MSSPLRRRIEKLERRAPPPQAIIEALSRRNESGDLPKNPLLCQAVIDIETFLQAADQVTAGIDVGE